MNPHHENSQRRDRGAASSSALSWVAALLAVTTVVAGLGWAGVIGGSDDNGAAPAATSTTVAATTTSTTPPTEWSALAATESDVYVCPAGEVRRSLAAGDTVVVTGRAEGNAWLAIQDPGDAAATAWVRAGSLTADASSPVWGDLPLISCDRSGSGVQTFSGTVVDSVTGAAVAGVSLAPTDANGAPLAAYAVTSAADGSYEIGGLVDLQYGLSVDGTAVGYEVGFSGALVGPLGFAVWPTWGEGTALATPGALGDIALRSTGAPITASTTTVLGAVPPGTTLVPVGPNVPPTIGPLTSSKAVVYSDPGVCSTTTAVLSVDVTDATGVKEVTVRWSYRSSFGTKTMYRVGTSNTFQATVGPYPDPTTPVSVKLEVTATDTEDLVATQAFTALLTLKRC